MSQAFISYSRKDREFVAFLHQAFAGEKREAWIDWEGIPPSAEFLQEIYSAIEAADTFLFVLSPDSVTSEVCGKELEHAIQFKKRLIPIVYRSVDAQQVHPTLAALNWIIFSDPNQFQKSFQQLLTAIDTDLEYVHQSTRFLVRAKQWEDAHQNPSLALRGAELAAAERWLAESANQPNGPTALQIQFITSSRRVASTIQRLVIGGLSIGIVVTLILALISVRQTQFAQSQQQQAQKNAQIALARQFDAQAQAALLQGRTDLALLLNLKAYQTDANAETLNNLNNTLHYNPYFFKEFADRSVTLSGDGHLLAIIRTTDHHLELWNRVTQAIQSLALTPDQQGTVVLNMDGSQVITGHTVWNVATQKSLATIPDDALAFSPDNQWLLTQACNIDSCTTTVDYRLTLWSLASGVPLHPHIIAPHVGTINAVAFSPDSKELVVGGCTALCLTPDPQEAFTNLGAGSITLWDVVGSKLLAANPLNAQNGPILGVAFGPGKVFSTGCEDQLCTRTQIVLWDISSGKLANPTVVRLTAEQLQQIAISQDGQRLLSGGCTEGCDKPEVLFWDGISTNNFSISTLSHAISLAGISDTAQSNVNFNSVMSSVQLSADGQWLVAGGNQQILWHLQQQYPGTDAPGSLLQYLGYAENVAFSPDGSLASGGGLDNSNNPEITGIPLWDAHTGDLVGQLQNGDADISNETHVLFSPDSKTLISLNGNTVELWDVASRKLISRSPTIGQSIDDAQFSPDLTTLAINNENGTFTIIDLKTGKTVSQLGDLASGDISYTYSPDGKMLAIGAERYVALWDVQSGKRIGQPFTGFATNIADVAFSPDGLTLAAMDGQITTKDITEGTYKPLVIVWNIKSGKELQRLSTDPGFENDPGRIAFSPDSKEIATSADFNISIWDWASGKKLPQTYQAGSPDHALGGSLNDLRFSPDGKTIAAVNQRGIFYFTLPNVADTLAKACQAANRNLTADEWRQYVGAISSYQKTCQSLPVENSVIEAWLDMAHRQLPSDHLGARQSYAQAIKWATESPSDAINDEVCWRGSVNGFAQQALAACARALAIVPNDGSDLDSRGLARALTGDLNGASADFSSAVQWWTTYKTSYDNSLIPSITTMIQERSAWISALKNGHNPFDATTLQHLQSEKYPEPVLQGSTPTPTATIIPATATANAKVPYKASIPGACDTGSATWIANSPITTQCLKDGLEITNPGNLVDGVSLDQGSSLHFANDYSVDFDVQFVSNTPCVGDRLRVALNGGGYGFIACYDGSTAIVFYDESGKATVLSSTNAVAQFGALHHFHTQVQGSSLQLQLDGGTPLTTVEASYSATAQIALVVWNPGNTGNANSTATPGVAIFSNFVYTPLN